MDFENDLEQNPNRYNDDHDSDLESRLYAEIHFSNNIIGEESNSISNKGAINTLNSDTSRINTVQAMENLKETQSSSTNNVTKSSIPDIERIQKENAANKSNRVSAKRSTTNNSKESNKSSKKRKSDSGTSKQVNQHLPPPNSNQIINPYNKSVSKYEMVGLPLLSPELINLLFKVKPPKQRVKNKNTKLHTTQVPQQSKTQSKAQSKTQSTTQTQSSATIFENEPVHASIPAVEVPQNYLEKASPVIDISSDDSGDDDSKYNRTIATDKKLCKKKTVITNHNESTSDSEESIFEVPVPPKPKPPVIELKDSGSEVNSDRESDNSDSNSQNHNPQNKDDNALNPISDHNTTTDSIDCTIEEPDNIILNCSEIQKGVSSLGEIKEMNHLSNPSSVNAINNTQNCELQQNSSHNVSMCRTENLSNQSTNSVNKNKVVNTLSKKQSSTRSNRKTVSNEEYFFQPMNDKMKAFYNESWGGENFSMEELKSKMSTDPNKWAILNTDVIASFAKRKRYFGMVCSRCHKDGHRQNQCTEAIKLPACHMCGEIGHIEISCPKKMCLTCGKKQNSYRKTCENCRKMSCQRCQSQGHTSNSCPDLWRRYHQTINKANADTPSNLRFEKSKHQMQCCNCARKGHVSGLCSKLRWSQHFPNPEFVTCYYGPAYSQDYNSSINLNDTIESTADLSSTHDSSFNISSTLNNSNNMELMNDAQSENQGLLTSLVKTTRNSKTPPIHIRQKVFDNVGILKRSTLEINLNNKNASIDYGNWTYLENFLNSFVTITPSEFWIQQHGRQMRVRMKCVKKLKPKITDLIEQYASRNSEERSRMLLTCETLAHKLINNLSERFQQLNNLNEDPIKLYEESRRLSSELMNKENQVTGTLDYSLKANRIAFCQRNLLMILYREGFLDNSLKKLKEIYTQLSTDKKYEKKSNVATVPIKNVLPYLYYFNNVFSPYEHPQINVALRKFKEHLERYNRLKSDPLFSSQISNELVNNESYENVRSHGITAVATSSTSHASPLLPNFVPRVDSLPTTPNRHQEHRTTVQDMQGTKSTEQLKRKKKVSKSKAKDQKKAQENFKKLINTAIDLNLPHLHKQIEMLQKKMEKEILLYAKDIKFLKQNVKKELKRRREKRR